MNFTKIVKADLDSPRRELSNGGFEVVVALLVRSRTIFCVLIADSKSSCNHVWPTRPLCGVGMTSINQGETT